MKDFIYTKLLPSFSWLAINLLHTTIRIRSENEQIVDLVKKK